MIVTPQIRITEGKGNKDRIVPFPDSFKEMLAIHAHNTRDKGGEYLFESSWKRPYTDRGIRKILEQYSLEAGMEHSISPHKLRHFLFTWLKSQGVDDALYNLIQVMRVESRLKYTQSYQFLTRKLSMKMLLESFPSEFI